MKGMILIDRPMPEACDVCPCMYDYIQCTALKDNEHESLSACDDYTKRQEWCPIKEVVLCKDCKHFQYKDYWADIGHGAKVLASDHCPTCNKWGNGCKTEPEGYCFLAERIQT